MENLCNNEWEESKLECDECKMKEQCKECDEDRICCNCELDCDEREE